MQTKSVACVCAEGDQRFFISGRCLACRGTQLRDLVREKVLIANLRAKHPSVQDYLAFDGAHCRDIYRNLSKDWSCPSCKRTKFEVMRWTVLYPDKPMQRHEGWAGGFHRHHDHGAERGGVSRFESAVICEQCNSTDGTVKRKLKLPATFSFSPLEIQKMVTPFPHGRHLIDYDVAFTIYAAH